MINKKGYSASIPKVTPVGFKPTTFRTFFYPDISYWKKFLYDKKVTPVGFKPTTFRTGI